MCRPHGVVAFHVEEEAALCAAAAATRAAATSAIAIGATSNGAVARPTWYTAAAATAACPRHDSTATGAGVSGYDAAATVRIGNRRWLQPAASNTTTGPESRSHPGGRARGQPRRRERRWAWRSQLGQD